MKTKLLIIIGVAFLPSLLVSVSAQYMGNLNQYDGNHTSQGPFPSESLSLEQFDEIKKIIISDDAFQNLVDGKPFLFYDGNGYAGSTGTGEWDPVIMLNVNNETTVSILFSLQEKKILQIDSYEMERILPAPDVPYGTNVNEMFDEDTESSSIEETLRIASGTVNAEWSGGGSGTPIFDVSGFHAISIITGILIAIGSFLGLMIYWRKRK
ncbi:MAG: hypothetical protein EPO37_00955 [Nitrosarchaeum sp.]|nr:MAG: hypothetical protein EPO37_00955 [Nitrosarchaeum sp.]